MILKLIDAIYGAVTTYAGGRVVKLMEWMYPDPEDRAGAYMAEGARIIEAMQFGEGELLHSIVMHPAEDGGYYIEALAPEEADA